VLALHARTHVPKNKTLQPAAAPAPVPPRSAEAKGEFVAAYKTLLRDVIDRNPSGLRLRIAKALGTHRSFLSQITNPQDPTPIPAKHVRSLFDLCHFSASEREQFLAAYQGAHPKRAQVVAAPAIVHATPAREGLLQIELPQLDDPRRQRELESLVTEFVGRLAEILLER